MDELNDFAVRTNYPSLTFGETKTDTPKRATKDAQNMGNTKEICLLHDSPETLYELLGQNRFGSSGKDSKNGSSSRFDHHEGLLEFLSTLLLPHRPLVIIVSDVVGQDDTVFATRNIIPPSVRDRVIVDTIFCPPVTPLQTRKALTTILNQMVHSKQQIIPAHVLEDIAAASAGDLRSDRP